MQIPKEQVIALANKFGTPLYVYNAEKIKEQYQKLLHSFSNVDVKFFYAAKALTNINILRIIHQMGCNVDCSSINEVRLAFRAGFAAQQILYTSNNISFDEIIEAKELNVHINIDSLSNLEKFGNFFGDSYPVGVRLRPNIMAGGNLKISTGHAESKFGIPLSQLQELVQLKNKTGLVIHGLHIHTGSEIKDVEIFAEGIKLLFEAAQFFPELKFLDLGGGFKVPYKIGEEGTDIEKLGKKLRDELEKFSQKTGRLFQVWFEPGKFLVSEAGYLITKVNVLKKSEQIQFVGVDTGLNHFIRPMFYGAYHEIENISNPTGEKILYNVVGNICETDNFAENRLLPKVRENDLLVFHNAGAYCFEMSSNYNARTKPAEVLIKNEEAYLIRKRQQFDDLLNGQIELI